MPGPPPKPTALKRIQGNPGKRKLNGNEPEFTGTPACPAWLNAGAKTEWNRILTNLEALNMLRSVDSSALAAYCQSYSRWSAAEQILDDEGQTVKEPVVNKAGKVVGQKIRRHPAVGIAKDALASMLRASALFGFDPSSRSRIHLTEPPQIDPFAQFMAGMGATEAEDAHAEESPTG